MNMMDPIAMRLPLLLVVDDEATNLQLLRQILSESYRLLFAKDGVRALELARTQRPDLILLDVMMPGMTGFEVCRQLKAQPETAAIPVIFITALTDVSDEVEGFAAGAVDYLVKPVSPPVVHARVRNHLSLVHLDELQRNQLQIVRALGTAAEYKDTETGLHVMRMSHYAQVLALAAGLSVRHAEDLLNAAPMHDIGKIGIPDAILQKPGKLDPDEWDIMRTHTTIGARIIGPQPGGMLAIAYNIALHHHERWDGSGYPIGLAGETIPFEARIVTVVDVFDALTSQRPYKKPWTVEQALQYLQENRGVIFDPQLVDLFIQEQPRMMQIFERWRENN